MTPGLDKSKIIRLKPCSYCRSILQNVLQKRMGFNFKKWQIMKIKLPSWLSLYSQVIVATEHVLYLRTYISQVSSIIEPIRKRHCVEGYFSTRMSHHPCLLSYLPFIYGLSQALHVTCSENGTINNDWVYCNEMFYRNCLRKNQYDI